jgi:hypothetical protein
MLINPNEYLHERVRSAGHYLLPSVRQLISIDAHGEPDPVGSCVLLWYKRERYLISAAHVLDCFVERPLYVGTLTKWHHIQGEFRATNIPTGKTREEDPYDYGFMAINEADTLQLDGCHFLTGDQIATRERQVFGPPYRSKYTALGWPRNRLYFDRKEEITEPETLAYTGVTASPETYRIHERNPRHQLLLEFSPKEVASVAGRQRPPSFDGLSGGGIFTMPGLQRIGDVSPPRLVGITTEVWAQHDLFIGTRIDLIFAAIERSNS